MRLAAQRREIGIRGEVGGAGKAERNRALEGVVTGGTDSGDAGYTTATVATSMAERRALWPLLAALLLVAIVIVVGLVERWTVALPVVALLRFGAWLGRGVWCTVPVLAGGALLVRAARVRTDGMPTVLTIALCWGAGWVVVIALGLATLAAGCYSPLVWQALAVAGWIGAVAWLAARRWSPLGDLWRRLLAGSQSGLPLLSWGALLAALAVLAAVHASLPPDTRDELCYHLVLPQLWAYQGDWWIPADNFPLVFPANAELTWAWAAAVGGPLAPRFVTLAFALLAIGLLREWLSSEGAQRWLVDAGLVVLLAAPAALTAAAICYVEWPLAFFLLLGWRAARDPLLRPGDRIAVVASAWAVAAGMKYTAPLLVGLLAVEWTARLWRNNRRQAARAALALAVATAALGAPWWLRNLAATGDPAYPLGAAVGLGAGEPAAAAGLLDYVELTGAWRWLPWLYHATADPVVDHRLHPLWPLVHLAVIAIGWRWRRDLPWLTVAGATVALLPFHPTPRVWLPLLGLDILFLPRLLSAAAGLRAARRMAGAAVLAAVLVSAPLSFHYLLVAGGPAVPAYLLGLIDRAQFLRDRDLVTPAVDWIHRQTPEEARIWAWCEDRTLYLDRWTRSDPPFGPPAFLTTLTQGGPAALTAAAEQVDLVVVRRDRCPVTWDEARFEKNRYPIGDGERSALAAWTAGHLAEVVRDDRYTVYRVVR